MCNLERLRPECHFQRRWRRELVGVNRDGARLLRFKVESRAGPHGLDPQLALRRGGAPQLEGPRAAVRTLRVNNNTKISVVVALEIAQPHIVDGLEKEGEKRID